jgi:hypothetical protein
MRPVNYKELFNLRHASLHDVVECIIGVWKKHFHIIREFSDYPMEMQVTIIWIILMRNPC